MYKFLSHWKLFLACCIFCVDLSHPFDSPWPSKSQWLDAPELAFACVEFGRRRRSPMDIFKLQHSFDYGKCVSTCKKQASEEGKQYQSEECLETASIDMKLKGLAGFLSSCCPHQMSSKEALRRRMPNKAVPEYTTIQVPNSSFVTLHRSMR